MEKSGEQPDSQKKQRPRRPNRREFLGRLLGAAAYVAGGTPTAGAIEGTFVDPKDEEYIKRKRVEMIRQALGGITGLESLFDPQNGRLIFDQLGMRPVGYVTTLPDAANLPKTTLELLAKYTKEFDWWEVSDEDLLAIEEFLRVRAEFQDVLETGVRFVFADGESIYISPQKTEAVRGMPREPFRVKPGEKKQITLEIRPHYGFEIQDSDSARVTIDIHLISETKVDIRHKIYRGYGV
jgi:hypothetical protein